MTILGRSMLALSGAALLIAVTPEAPRRPADPELSDRLTVIEPDARSRERGVGAIRPVPLVTPDAPSGEASERAAKTAAERPAPPAPAADAVSIAKAEVATPNDAPETDSHPDDADLLAQFAYADVRGPVADPITTASLEPSAGLAPAAPDLPAPQARERRADAAALYSKGDSAALRALAGAATEPAQRIALEWAALRADAHPSFAALAAFLAAHPAWPSAGWIALRQEAELAQHPLPPAKAAVFFAANPPQSSQGKIAAARAASAMGRTDEAAQIVRALWRDGNDAWSEGVILREFSGALTKPDHTYRADRLVYAGYPSAAARAAALAGPDVLALTEARIAAAREPLTAALLRSVPPALRIDPGLDVLPRPVRAAGQPGL